MISLTSQHIADGKSSKKPIHNKTSFGKELLHSMSSIDIISQKKTSRMEFEQSAFSVLANSFQEVSLFVDPSMKVLTAYGPTFRFTGIDPRDLSGSDLFSLFTQVWMLSSCLVVCSLIYSEGF